MLTKMEDDQNGRRPRPRPRSINNWRFKADLRFVGFLVYKTHIKAIFQPKLTFKPKIANPLRK